VPPSLRVPDARLHLARRDADPDPDPGVVEEVGTVLGELVDRDAVGADPLPRVAPRPAEADADHRETEVVRRLDEVAGEDPKATRVDRELLVEPELHAEVGDAGGHERGSGDGSVSAAADRRLDASRGTPASPPARPA